VVCGEVVTIGFSPAAVQLLVLGTTRRSVEKKTGKRMTGKWRSKHFLYVIFLSTIFLSVPAQFRLGWLGIDETDRNSKR
jgi:hypothetical protein